MRCHGGLSRTGLDGWWADRALGQILHCLVPTPPIWHQEAQETARGKQPQAVTCEIRSHKKKTSCHWETMLMLIGTAFLGSCKINILGRMLPQALTFTKRQGWRYEIAAGDCQVWRITAGLASWTANWKIQRCVAPPQRPGLLNEIYYFCKIWK